MTFQNSLDTSGVGGLGKASISWDPESITMTTITMTMQVTIGEKGKGGSWSLCPQGPSGA